MFLTYLKLGQVMLILAFYYSQVLIGNSIGMGSKLRSQRIRQKFANAVLRALNIRVVVEGEIPALNGVIFESNHKSMMDPIIFLSQASASPVAKAPISKYPLIGKAAKDTGIIYVDRNDDNSRAQTLVQMKEALIAGDNILIYPEGTISKDKDLLPFRNGSFILAADNAFPIGPVKITYPDESYHWTSGTLLNHFRQAFIGKSTVVHLEFFPIIESNDFTYLKERTYELLNN